MIISKTMTILKNSRTLLKPMSRNLSDIPDNVRIPEGTVRLWKYLSLFVAAPAVILASINTYITEKNHHIERPPFAKYPYLRIKSKPWPWGDGNHSLFHNPERNPLPDGYEDEL